MSESRCFALRSTIRSASRSRSYKAPSSFFNRRLVNPMMEFIGRSQLMQHVGQELAFYLVGALCRFLGRFQRSRFLPQITDKGLPLVLDQKAVHPYRKLRQARLYKNGLIFGHGPQQGGKENTDDTALEQNRPTHDAMQLNLAETDPKPKLTRIEGAHERRLALAYRDRGGQSFDGKLRSGRKLRIGVGGMFEGECVVRACCIHGD